MLKIRANSNPKPVHAARRGIYLRLEGACVSLVRAPSVDHNHGTRTLCEGHVCQQKLVSRLMYLVRISSCLGFAYFSGFPRLPAPCADVNRSQILRWGSSQLDLIAEDEPPAASSEKERLPEKGI